MSRDGTSSHGAIVLGANYRALSVVRSLGRHGIETCVVRTDEHAVAAWSRYASRQATLSASSPAEAADQLCEMAQARGWTGWMVIPTDDEDVELLASHHDQLRDRFRLSVLPRPAIAWALDKRVSYTFASEHGVEHPRTWSVPDPTALENPEITYPAIIKPRFRTRWLAARTPKAWRAENRDQLERAYRAAAEVMPPERLLVQELIPGGGESQLAYAAVCRDGAVSASLAARRLRQWPPDFGKASTYVETIDEAELAATAEPLLAVSGYTGLIELEFKRDPRDCCLKLLDVNPRVWGWISVGPRAGVDFPYVLWRMLLGDEIPRLRARAGVRWVRMATDIPAAVSAMPDELSRRQYLSSLRPPLACAIFAADDPLPTLIDAPLLASIGARRALRPTRGRTSSRPLAPDAPARRRALIIVENAPVPGDRRVWQEARSLHRAGWDVTVLAPHAPGDRQRPTEELIEGVRVCRFPLRRAEEGRLGHLGEYGMAMWRIWRAVRRLAREQPFDVIQACNPPDFLLLAALGQRRRGSRLIFDHHDLWPEMYACRSDGASGAVHRALLMFERLAFRLADVTLATNGSLMRIAVERDGKAADDVFVVRNGPMLESFRPLPRDPSLARGRAHLLVYVGLMEPTDGVDHALQALANLAERRRDWHALFLGDGEMLPELRQLVVELGLGDCVEFAGYVSDAEVRRAICTADVCLAPDPPSAYTHCSTLVKIAEYMALSRAIVGYDLVESRVTAGDAALFASDDGPAELARLIEELLDDPDRRRALGAEGRARVERELAWEYSEQALLAAYRRAVAVPRSRRRPPSTI